MTCFADNLGGVAFRATPKRRLLVWRASGEGAGLAPQGTAATQFQQSETAHTRPFKSRKLLPKKKG